VQNNNQIGTVTCSDDNTSCFFSYDNESEKNKIEYETKVHDAAVTGLDLHPLRYLLALASKDGTFSFHDISSVLYKIQMKKIFDT
jgi:WD40 repeat protein